LTSFSFNDVLIKVVGGTETCSEMSTTHQTFAAVDIVFPYFQCGKKVNLRIGQLKLRILKTVPQHFSIWHFAAHPVGLSPCHTKFDVTQANTSLLRIVISIFCKQFWK
jgi:hypothetical protein